VVLAFFPSCLLRVFGAILVCLMKREEFRLNMWVVEEGWLNL